MSEDRPEYPPYPPTPQYPPPPQYQPPQPPPYPQPSQAPLYQPPPYQQGPGYQQPPYPPVPGYPVPQYPGGPGWHEPPRPVRPASVNRAVQLMYIGAGLSIVALIVGLAMHGSFRSSIISANPNLTPEEVNSAVDFAFALVVVAGLIGAGLWVWMAWANGRGRNWARILGTVFFGIDTLGTLGDAARNVPAGSLVLAGLEWLIGLTVVILLWRRESTYFYRASKGFP